MGNKDLRLCLGNKGLPRLCLDNKDLLRLWVALALAVLAPALDLCQCKLAPDPLRLLHSRNATSCIEGRHQARDSRRTVYLPPVGDSIHEWVLRRAECLLWVCLQKNPFQL